VVDILVKRELNGRKLNYLGLGQVRADVVDTLVKRELNGRKLHYLGLG
jgi:hypothetical protein